jgi:hypothetical protein
MNKVLEIHVLQNFAPSNLNRDDKAVLRTQSLEGCAEGESRVSVSRGQ